MLKLIEIGTEDFGEPSVKVIDDWSGRGLVKSAADSRVSEFVSGLNPEPGKIYLHILAMGAGEFYGANRNSDYFPENALIDHHKTFETSPAHVFRSHINKDPTIAIGQVIFAVYNERMHRVELIVWVDKERGSDIVRRLENGEFPATSMACKTPYDICSICGNKAHTRQEYCDHLSNQLGRMYPDGRKVMALNVAALKFFDISIVVRPADVTSSVLQKVASSQTVTSSAELAEIEGLTEKKAAFKKLSEFVKELEGNVVSSDENLNSILAKVKDPLYESIPRLSAHDLSDVLATMAHLGISPSIRFLAELIGHKLSGPNASGIGDLVEGYVGSEGVKDLLQIDKSFDGVGEPNPFIMDLLMPSVKQASLYPGMVIDRASVPMFYESNGLTYLHGTGVGYAGNGPYIEETPVERFKRLAGDVSSHKPGGLMSMIKTLITIGGAALAAKWYITNIIEKKMQETQANRDNGVKIVLVKSASDYRSTYHLAKSAMINVLQKNA